MRNTGENDYFTHRLLHVLPFSVEEAGKGKSFFQSSSPHRLSAPLEHTPPRTEPLTHAAAGARSRRSSVHSAVQTAQSMMMCMPCWTQFVAFLEHGLGWVLKSSGQAESGSVLWVGTGPPSLDWTRIWEKPKLISMPPSLQNNFHHTIIQQTLSTQMLFTSNSQLNILNWTTSSFLANFRIPNSYLVLLNSLR